MRIGIDARLLGPKTAGGGLGRYIAELVNEIKEQDHENEYVLFLRKSNWDECPDAPNFKKVEADIPWYSLAEQARLPKIIDEENLDIVHFPHFNVPIKLETPFVVTIHDLILLEYPTRRASTLGPIKYFIKQLAHKKVLSNAIINAKTIIVPSDYTRKSILKFYPKTNPEKIKLIYEGVTPLDIGAGDPDKDKKFLEEQKITKPYLLYVGNSYPHKNLYTLVRAFQDVLDKKPGLQLVLVGQKNYFSERLERETRELGLEVPKEVNFTGFIEDEDLPRLYRNASLYVFPSLLEGFGLPPLEAMSYDLPVATSNASCLPEVLGASAIYFDPKDIEDMARVILEGLDNESLRKTLIKAGEIQTQRYCWPRMAKDILEIYQKSL